MEQEKNICRTSSGENIPVGGDGASQLSCQNVGNKTKFEIVKSSLSKPQPNLKTNFSRSLLGFGLTRNMAYSYFVCQRINFQGQKYKVSLLERFLQISFCLPEQVQANMFLFDGTVPANKLFHFLKAF